MMTEKALKRKTGLSSSTEVLTTNERADERANDKAYGLQPNLEEPYNMEVNVPTSLWILLWIILLAQVYILAEVKKMVIGKWSLKRKDRGLLWYIKDDFETLLRSLKSCFDSIMVKVGLRDHELEKSGYYENSDDGSESFKTPVGELGGYVDHLVGWNAELNQIRPKTWPQDDRRHHSSDE